MTVKEFLEGDNSYLIVPHKTKNIFSKAFWESADADGKEHSLAGTTGNQRVAYEAGVEKGWDMGMIETRKIHAESLSDEEKKNMIGLLSAMGYSCAYLQPFAGMENYGLSPGMNLIKNNDAIKAGVVVSDDTKKKVFDILKAESPDKRIWGVGI